MWVPKWYWKYASQKQSDLERRVKRLELILLEDAQKKIASLSNKETGKEYADDYLTIEEIINKSLNTG